MEVSINIIDVESNMTVKAAVFPGQGSQFIGMGKDLLEAFPIAKEVFQEVDETLGEHLSRLMFEGEADQLNLTSNTQPALMAVSVAIARVLEKESNKKLADMVGLVAGHSLGEYSALTAVHALSLQDCTKLLRIRGNAMQEAVPAGVGAMVALIGVASLEEANQIAESVQDKGICQVANDNGGGQVVLSGHTEAIDAIIDKAADLPIRKAVKLPVSAPFHCSLMQPAAKKMEEALADVTINTPSIPLIANVTADKVSQPEIIRQLLVEQVTGTVRWNESVAKMVAEQQVNSMIEIGAGKVLTGLARRIDKSLNTISVQSVADIEALLKEFA